MKKLITIIVLSLMIISAGTDAVCASELWSEDYYRANDNTGGLSETERDSLDSECIEFMQKYGTDIALISIKEEEYEGITLEESAKLCYDKYGYGYSDDRSCIIVICDVENQRAEIVTFGSAVDLLSQDYIDFIKSNIWKYEDEYGVYGVLYSAKRMISNRLDSIAEKDATEKDVTEEPAEEEPSTEDPTPLTGSVNGDKPYWYVSDPSSFKLYHNENAPRVVDDAGIFTQDEKQRMTARLLEIRNETGKDIVVFTDNSTFGIERAVYAADFFEMNGYGVGDEYEGMVLFVCMDPNDRGWWVACSGPETKGLVTEEVGEALDDVLYGYMKDGNYTDGIMNWMENERLLYLKGTPFAPEWMPGDGVVRRFHNADSLRIDDRCGFLDEEQVSALAEHAKRITDKYGIDVAIHTASYVSAVGYTVEDYAKLYYECNGLGLGDDYDGLLYVLIRGYGYNEYTGYLYASGKGLEHLNEINRSRIIGNFLDGIKSSSADPYKCFDRFLSQLDHMEKTGRVPRTMWYWGLMMIVGIIPGMIVGWWTLTTAKEKMAAPKLQMDAGLYLVAGSENITGTERFINTTTSRKYDPVVESSRSSSGSSSSSRSSYSSSYSSSSGNSHSGHGRNF